MSFEFSLEKYCTNHFCRTFVVLTHDKFRELNYIEIEKRYPDQAILTYNLCF